MACHRCCQLPASCFSLPTTVIDFWSVHVSTCVMWPHGSLAECHMLQSALLPASSTDKVHAGHGKQGDPSRAGSRQPVGGLVSHAVLRALHQVWGLVRMHLSPAVMLSAPTPLISSFYGSRFIAANAACLVPTSQSPHVITCSPEHLACQNKDTQHRLQQWLACTLHVCQQHVPLNLSAVPIHRAVTPRGLLSDTQSLLQVYTYAALPDAKHAGPFPVPGGGRACWPVLPPKSSS